MVKRFIAANKLSEFRWRPQTIEHMWKQPPPPLPKRSEEKKRKDALEVEENRQLFKNVHTGQWPGLKVAKDLPGRGRGIFTTRPFQRHEIVCHYTGTILEGQAAHQYIREREASCADTSYLLDFIDGNTFCCIDSNIEDGSLGRLINHSAKYPNVEKLVRTINGQRYLFFRMKDNIIVNRELLYNYGQRPSDTHPEWLDPKHCPCHICQP